MDTTRTTTLSKYVKKSNSKSVDTLGHSSLLCIEFWHKLPSKTYLLPISEIENFNKSKYEKCQIPNQIAREIQGAPPLFQFVLHWVLATTKKQHIYWKIKNQNIKNVKFQIRWDCERYPGCSASILEKFSGNSGGGGSGRKEQMSASPSSFPNHNHHHPFNHIFHHLFLIIVFINFCVIPLWFVLFLFFDFPRSHSNFSDPMKLWVTNKKVNYPFCCNLHFLSHFLHFILILPREKIFPIYKYHTTMKHTNEKFKHPNIAKPFHRPE